MKCLARIHPMKWQHHATHRGNRGATNLARIVMRKAKTRAALAVQKTSLARTRRKKFRSQRLVLSSLGSPTNTVTALTPSEALKFKL